MSSTMNKDKNIANETSSPAPPAQTMPRDEQAMRTGSVGARASSNTPSAQPLVPGSQGYGQVLSTVATRQNVPAATSQERDDVAGSSAVRKQSPKQMGVTSQELGGAARQQRPPQSTTARPDASVRQPASQREIEESPSKEQEQDQDQAQTLLISSELMMEFNNALRKEIYVCRLQGPGHDNATGPVPWKKSLVGEGGLGCLMECVQMPNRGPPHFVEVMNPTGKVTRVRKRNLFAALCLLLSGLYVGPRLEGAALEDCNRSIREASPQGIVRGVESDVVSSEYPPLPFLRVSQTVFVNLRTAMHAEQLLREQLKSAGKFPDPTQFRFLLETRMGDGRLNAPRRLEMLTDNGIVIKSSNPRFFATVCLFMCGLYRGPVDHPGMRQAVAEIVRRVSVDQSSKLGGQASTSDPNSQPKDVQQSSVELDSKTKRKRDRKKLKNASVATAGSEKQTNLDQTPVDQHDDVLESSPSPDSLEFKLAVDATAVSDLDNPLDNNQLGDGQHSIEGASASVVQHDTRTKSQIKKDKKKLKNPSISTAGPEQQFDPTPTSTDQLEDTLESSVQPSVLDPSPEVLDFELAVDSNVASTLDDPDDQLGDDQLDDLDVQRSSEGANGSILKKSKSKNQRKREKKKLNKNASGSPTDLEQQPDPYPTPSDQTDDLESSAETSDLVLSLDGLHSELTLDSTSELSDDLTTGDDQPEDIQQSKEGATAFVLSSVSKSKNRNKNKSTSASVRTTHHRIPSDQLGDVSQSKGGATASENALSNQRPVPRPQGYDPTLEKYQSGAPSQEAAPNSATTRKMSIPSTEESPYGNAGDKASVPNDEPKNVKTFREVLGSSEEVSASVLLIPANNRNKNKRIKDAIVPPPHHPTPSDQPLNIPQSGPSAGANAFFPPNDTKREHAQHPNYQPINVPQGRLNVGAKAFVPSPSRQTLPQSPSHVPQFHAYQGSPQGPSTEQEINEKYRQLELRGSFAVEDVSRESMDWCLNSSFYYDAIVPRKPTRPIGYLNSTTLDTNFFALTVNQEKYYQYMLDWRPEWLSTKTSDRIWRTRVWQKACRMLESVWKSQGSYVSPPHHGVGAYDLGTTMYRTEPIPEIVYTKELHRMKWRSIHSKSRHSTWDTSMQQIELGILDSSRTQRYEIVPTDMIDLRTTGGQYSKWYKFRNALNNILYTNQGLTNKWIEDRNHPRLLYPPGYPISSTDPLAKYVDHPTFRPSDYNDLYVFRRGFHSAARLFPGGVYVNVWTSYAPFFRSNLTVDYAMDVILKQKQLDPYDGRRLNKFELDYLSGALQHIRVMTKLTRKVRAFKSGDIPTRLYRIWGLSDIPCRDLRVPIFAQDSYGSPTTKQISIQPFLPFCETLFSDAFRAWPELDFQLVKDNLKGLPAVKVHKTRDYYFPPWALEIKENDKHSVKKGGILSETTYRMREESYHKIGAFAYIDLVADYVKWWISSDKVLPSFNIQINPTPLRVKGCFLPVPQSLLCYDYNSQTLFPPNVRSYGWFLNTQQDLRRASSGRAATTVGMLQCPNIRTYMILYLKPTTEAEARDWIQLFLSTNGIRNGKQAFGSLHMKTPFIKCCGESNAPRENFLSEFNNALNECRVRMKGSLPDVIFLMMPSWRADRQPYHAFKYKCDVELGVKSQVILMRRWEGMNPNSIISSMLCVLLKFNKKMGGQNLVLRGPYVNDEAMPGTMIFGADVTHPTSDVSHSIASVVATNDMPPRTYGARVKIQGPKIEMLIELEDMVESLVKVYIKNNPNIPLRRVFFFRDGVGDDQLKDVLGQEIPAIFNGLARAGAQAKLVYLICIKRHHTRFRDPKSGDIQPGCAVNDMPMFPLQTSFYLCTHLHPPPWVKNCKGLCRATFYHVLVDQLGMSLPELQAMIYHLSFVYERSNINLSVVPASHYSHLACSRGRIHFKELLTISPTIDNHLPNERMKYVGFPYPWGTRTDLTPHDDVKDTMYYL